jgi:hypothetical protein
MVTFNSQCSWYDKKGNHAHAFMTRCSPDLNNPNKRFKEMLVDVEIRDRFVAQTGNVLDQKR